MATIGLILKPKRGFLKFDVISPPSISVKCEAFILVPQGVHDDEFLAGTQRSLLEQDHASWEQLPIRMTLWARCETINHSNTISLILFFLNIRSESIIRCLFFLRHFEARTVSFIRLACHRCQ